MKISIITVYFLIFIITIGFFFIFFQDFFSGNSVNNESNMSYYPTPTNDNSDKFSSSIELHWTHMPLTYSFSTECTNLIKSRNRRAFYEITNQTDGVITFQEKNNTPVDISLVCYKSVPTEGFYLTAGEAQYWSEGNKITKAVINYYNAIEGNTFLGCVNFPDTEIHEILHTFGFGHKPGFNTIMREVQGICLYKIDADIIEELKSTYYQ
jgi:hypothetical protein